MVGGQHRYAKRENVCAQYHNININVSAVDREDVLDGGLEGVAALLPDRERGAAVDAAQLAPDPLPLETVRHL